MSKPQTNVFKFQKLPLQYVPVQRYCSFAEFFETHWFIQGRKKHLMHGFLAFQWELPACCEYLKRSLNPFRPVPKHCLETPKIRTHPTNRNELADSQLWKLQFKKAYLRPGEHKRVLTQQFQGRRRHSAESDVQLPLAGNRKILLEVQEQAMYHAESQNFEWA